MDKHSSLFCATIGDEERSYKTLTTVGSTHSRSPRVVPHDSDGRVSPAAKQWRRHDAAVNAEFGKNRDARKRRWRAIDGPSQRRQPGVGVIKLFTFSPR